MRIVLRAVAVFLVAIGALLLYAVIAALTSDEGARVGVCIGYVVGAVVLGFLAAKLWNLRGPSASQAV